ncbi:hypothetical protein F511_35888 [Dorcoceras hygrometricum]|uniref:Uncharacterized protein n=1 Tax=Dorcoceras hygrometricum TaxID=472368 RepID=A0A2Z7AXG2_9LAMI|nr:hypothetical protein F511_35888 [Dorcoceras hygrometricum]
MADPASYGNPDRDTEQALIALKKGTQLIKYSRKGKPKFRTFRLSPDETTLIWYSHKEERHLKLSSVLRILPGQRTPVFKRYLRPEKEYLSFSLIYNNGDRSLDLICKDKAESEIWLAGLKALISTGQARSKRTRSDISDLAGFADISQDTRPLGASLEYTSSIPRGRSFAECSNNLNCSSSHVGSECANMQIRTSGADGFRISVSSTPSCSSQGSGPDDIESLGDVYVWGEIWSDGGATDGIGNLVPIKNDVLVPKPLESNVVLDVHQIACGVRHVALVTRQGEVFTWGEESGGRLGHGIEKDFSRPRLVEFLAVTNVDFVSCGEFHTCALSTSGDLYTWGDGTHNAGLLGHGNDVSHWIPKRVSGPLEGLQVLTVACGTWHSALATSTGKLFTFGDGTFGALGHGDRESIPYPKEVQSLNGLKTVAVSCGVWHTAAIVEVTNQSGSSVVSSRKLFTWGDGDKYRLGHGNKETYLVPTCVSALIDYNINQLACGHNITVVLTTSGHVFTMGSNTFGQLGNPQSDGKSPSLIQDRLVGEQAFGFTRKRHNCYNCGLVHCHACSSKKALKAALAPTPGKPHRVCDSCYLKLKKSAEAGNVGTFSRRASGPRRSMDMSSRADRGEGRTSRLLLSPTVEPIKYLEVKSGTQSDNYSIVRASQVPSLLQLKDVAFPSSLSALQYALKPVITSAPQIQQLQVQTPSQSNSRPASPYSRRPSPPRSAAPVFSRGVIDSLKKTNDLLTQEISKLHGQIKSLKQKSEAQESELQKLKAASLDATSPAHNRYSNFLKSTDAVQTIRDRLNDIKEMLPPEISESESFKAVRAQVGGWLDAIGNDASEDKSTSPSERSNEPPNYSDKMALAQESSSKEDHRSEDREGVDDLSQNRIGTLQETGEPASNAKVANQSSVGSGSGTPQAARTEGMTEVIEQFEPGVYVTLVQLANGTKIFKAIRFSKRKFDEHQAEEWWKENRERLMKKYSPAKTSNTPTEVTAAQPPEEEGGHENNEAPQP